MSVVKAGVLEGSSDSEEEVHVYKLKIHDTEVKDAGEWRVEVADKYGSTSTSCNLAIRDDPKPKPSVTYAGKVGDKGDNSDDEEVHLYKLRIHDAKAEDAGRWRCEVEDKYGSASSSCNLMLDPYNRPSRPKFVTYLKDQKVEEGFSVRFQCVVTGNPVPRIEWYKDMEPVSKSSFMYTSYRGDGTASLQLFSPVADRDNGTYRCVARNSEGSSYSEAILTIHKQITNADLRDQFSISRARTRNEDLANFTGHHISKFQAAERMMLKSDQYTFETSPHLKKSELYHLDTQFKGHRKSDLYSSTGGRRAKKYESPDWEEETFDKRSSYNIENDYSPRKRYEDEYKIDLKGKSDVYNFENDYKIKSKSDPYKTDYMYGGKRDILDEMDYQRKLESKKSYDSLTSKRSFDKGFDKSSSNDIGFKYIPRRRELSKEINPGLSTRAKELSRGRSAGSAFDIGRSKSVSLGRDVSSRLILDDKKGYYTLRPRPKSVSLSRDSPMYDNRAKSMSVARDFGIKSGYESDKEDVYGAPRSRPKSASFSRELDSSRRTRSASLAREFAVKPETKFEDEHIYSKRDDRARSMSLSRDTEELIRNLRESSVGRSEFADIEAYRAELHKKQTKDKSKRSTTCKKKQRGKELKYQTFSKHFEDENKPIKEINPGLSMKAREIVNRQGYRYKVDRDLLNISMSRNRNKSHQTEDSGENELIVNGYRKPAETREPKSDEEEELSNEAFKRKTYLQNLDRFINRANQSFYDIEDSEVPSWRKEKLQDTGYDYTSHMARKNKIELFDFDDIRTSKVALRRDQQPRRAQSVGPELEPPKSKSANTRYNKERQALLNLGTNWVKDKPLAFIERLKSKSVLEGNSVLLSCFVTGKEPFVVLWYRRGIPLSRDEEETFHIRSNGGFLSLEVPIASTYDTGEYVVEVRNEEGKIKSSCYLQVEPIFDPRVEYKQPEFIEQIHHVHAKVGQAATFTCRVKGTPNPFVRWFKDGIELQQTDRINIHQGEKGQAFLLIHDTVEQDTGLYKCVAQSMAGRCQSTAKLQILESMADAFDDVSCNMEVERIISQTKFAKGDVGEASIQKPKAWRASLETTPATATVDQLTTQKETLEARKQSDVKESPLKASEILTVLDETLKAAQRVSSPIEKKVKPTEPDAAETSKIQKISLETKPESTKPAEDVPRTDVIDGKNVAAVGDEVTEIEVKETTTEKSGQIQAEKTDVKEVGEGKETVKQQKETPIEEASVETEKKKDVTETPVQAEKKEDVTDGSVQAEKKEDVKEESPGTVAALAEKEDSVPKEEEREPQPPTFVKKLPEKMDLKDGEDLLLQCITDGLPKPDVLWLHEKKVVEASQNVIIKDSHDVHSLEIKKVSHQVHSGSYIAKLIGGSGTSEEEEVVSSCKVFILSTAPAEQKAVMTEENIQDKDIIPVVERQISTDQEELKLKIPASVDLQEVCEEGQLDPDKMHIPMVSPTGVHCHSSPLDKASKEEELPPSQTSPHFTQPLDEELYPLERDENVRIQCVVAGEPCPKIVWFKDGEKLEPSSRIRLEWDPDTRIASVLLKRLHILDTGEYECIVYGENGSYSTKTTLHVKALEMQKVETIDRDDPPESVSPKFFLSLKDKKVYEGKGTTLDCVIKGVPQPTVKWLRHGKEIFPRSGKYLLTAINQQYSLTIEDFKKSDEGCYTVEAMNDSGSCSSSAYLTMEAVVAEVEKAAPENSPPEFTSKMEGLMVPVGGVVTFKCSASGYPVPKFKWQKDLLDVYQSKRITIDNTPGETTLTISDVTRRDGGMYVCVAKNTLGRNKQTVKLIVSDDCRETRRLSISGEIDRPDEQIISQSDSINKMNDDVATETNLNVIEEQQLIQEKKDTGSEKVEQTTVNQQPEEAKTPEKEESVVAEDATQPENQPLSKDISQTNEAMTEESGKTPTVSSNDKQKEIEEVAEKDVQKNSDTLDAKTEVGQKVEVQEIQPTVQEEQPLKEEKGDESRISEGKAAAVEEEPVQVSEDKIVSSLKTVGSEAEVSLMENIDFVSVENASFIQKEQTLADESTVENVEVQKVETDGQISKSEKKNAEEMMTSPKIDDQEKVKQLSEKVSSNEEKGVDSKTSESGESLKIKNDKIADTEKCSDIKTSASSASSISEEVTVKKSVQTAESTATIKTVTEDVELDIDHLVEQAETILGESVSSKSEVQDVSFEEVLAKSVLEESVAEAAGEMEKINKTKKRRLSKTKRRSMSLESEEVTDEKDAAERTSTPIKELETGSATGVTGSTTKKEVSTSQRSTKTKSVSFEEIVETSGSSDAVDSSKTSSKTSSKATVSESFTESSASVVEIKSAKEMSVSEKETTSESTAAVKTEKREIRALDRMMSMEDVKDILDVDTLKMNETREAIVEQKTASGKTQVLEVSARRVSKQLSVEEQAKVATHSHHLHHPPEIIVPPENQFVSLHSEIELTVKVRAAHGAKISWYHDGHQVAVTGEHYELMDEEVAEDK